LAFALLPLVTGAAVMLWARPRLWLLLLSVLVCELASQVLGRSLLKFGVDLGIWGIVVGNHVLRELYGSAVLDRYSGKALSALHSELVGVLRVAITSSFFVIGTLGISVASNYVTRYFGGKLAQGTAWAYVASILYIFLGLFGFLMLPVFSAMVRAREKIRHEA